MSNDPSNTLPAERTEPSAGAVPVPVWWFVALAVLAFWAMTNLDHRGGGFTPKVYPPFRSEIEVSLLHVKSGADAQYANGERIYKQFCLACHQQNGMGTPGLNPPLAGSEWVVAEGPNRIIRAVLNGLQGPIEVSGKSFTGSMPAWGAVIPSDQDLADLMTYIRQNKDWGNDASAVTTEQVTAIRASVKDRPVQWTADELKAIPVKD
jgi:mono/diheme cytochrome c family protein